MTPPTPPHLDQPLLDHVVFNVRFQMDEGANVFESLGFTLTPRGHHTLGSINHLMIFDNNYLELLGLPEESSSARPELARAPVGLNGLVFKTNNVDHTFAHLQRIGLAGDPPNAFSRPVQLAGETRDARFRTVHVRADRFPGRVYFCEHGTPDLVWRADWQKHANSASSITEFVVVALDPAAEAKDYAALVDVQPHTDGDQHGERHVVDLGKSRIAVITPETYAKRFGSLACTLGERQSLFGAVVLKCDLEQARAGLQPVGSGVATLIEPDRLVTRIKALDCLLEWHA